MSWYIKLLMGMIIGVILCFTFSKHKNFCKRYKIKVIAVSIAIVVLILLILLGYAIFLFFYGKGITDNERLSALSSFIGPILGFLSTFIIFKITSDIQKKQEKEYYNEMLFSLLRYTIQETSSIVTLIHNKFLISEIVEGKTEIYKNLEKTPKDEHRRLCKEIENLRKNKHETYKELEHILAKNLKDNLVYDEDWTKYLRYEYAKNRRNIINWINILNNKDLDVSLFLMNRNIISIIVQIKELNYIDKVDLVNDHLRDSEYLIKETMDIYTKKS